MWPGGFKQELQPYNRIDKIRGPEMRARVPRDMLPEKLLQMQSMHKESLRRRIVGLEEQGQVQAGPDSQEGSSTNHDLHTHCQGRLRISFEGNL